MLVHGWADASGWNQEIVNLEKLGYPVLAPSNPLRDFAPDSDHLHSILTSIKGPIVLVGHSYGGAVISNAAVGVPDLKALVYLAGWAPDKGDSIGRLDRQSHRQVPRQPKRADHAVRPQVPARRRRSGRRHLPHETRIRDRLRERCPDEGRRRIWAEQRPFSQAAFAAPSGEPAWKTIPSWYLVSTEDHAIQPATQMFMAKRAHATIKTVRASHIVLVSHPTDTTNIILQAAKTVG